jgi:hypothetical protein
VERLFFIDHKTTIPFIPGNPRLSVVENPPETTEDTDHAAGVIKILFLISVIALEKKPLSVLIPAIFGEIY